MNSKFGIDKFGKWTAKQWVKDIGLDWGQMLVISKFGPAADFKLTKSQRKEIITFCADYCGNCKEKE